MCGELRRSSARCSRGQPGCGRPTSSVADYQRSVRLGHLETTIYASAHFDLVDRCDDGSSRCHGLGVCLFHVLGRRERVVPVVEGGRFLGLARLEDISELDRGQWEETAIGDQMATDLPVGQPSWTLRDAVRGHG